MSPAGCRAFFAFAICGLLPALASAAEQGDSLAPIDFSVLTPAMAGKFQVASGVDFTGFIPPYFAFSRLASGQKSTQLRSLVEREHYDPARTIADRLIEALGEASFRAVYEPIGRKTAGSIQSLSWSDLPEKPRGKLMLDVTINWICLCSDVAFTKLYPAISMGWRLLDPAREVVEPTRNLLYFHFPAWYERDRSPATKEVGKTPESEYPVVAVSESCGFNSVKAAEKDPQILWGCFGEAYDAALRRLVIDLKKVHPPRPAVTASADTPS